MTPKKRPRLIVAFGQAAIGTLLALGGNSALYLPALFFFGLSFISLSRWWGRGALPGPLFGYPEDSTAPKNPENETKGPTRP